MAEIGGLVGTQSASAIQTMIEKARTPATGIFATVLSLITLLLGATGVVGELKDTLNTIWHVEPAPEMGLLRTLKTRLVSLAFVLGLGFLLLVSLVISAVLSALQSFFSHLFSSPWILHILQVVNFVVSLGVITVLFAMLYRFLPDTEVAWHDVWIGAGMTALLFVISKFLIGLYLGRSSMASAYGPAGSLVLILAWVYYSSLVLLLGAEFTEIYAHRYGSRATSAAAPPLPQPRESTPPVVPQGVRHVPSPGYGRYVTAMLIFVAGMIIGARRRARYS
jgi:membrane protein